jgi:hypothetical protein
MTITGQFKHNIPTNRNQAKHYVPEITEEASLASV